MNEDFEKSYADALVGLNPNSISNQRLSALIDSIPEETRNELFHAAGEASEWLLEYYRNKDKPIFVIFSHGKESGPYGTKIKRLMEVAEECQISSVSVDYRECANADERVALLKETIARSGVSPTRIVLVGSSMGGYVSTVVAGEMPVAGLFFMAPALWMPAEEYSVQSYQPLTTHIEIVHGLHDDIVPYENSIRFARENSCTTTLHLVQDDHRLKDSHDLLADLFKRFISLQNPNLRRNETNEKR